MSAYNFSAVQAIQRKKNSDVNLATVNKSVVENKSIAKSELVAENEQLSEKSIIRDNLTVTGNTNLANVSITGAFTTTGSSKIGGTFGVTGYGSIGGYLNVAEHLQVAGPAMLSKTTIADDATVKGTLEVAGTTTLNSALQSGNINVGSKKTTDVPVNFMMTMASNNVIKYTETDSNIDIWATKIPIHIIKNIHKSNSIQVATNELESMTIISGGVVSFVFGAKRYNACI